MPKEPKEKNKGGRPRIGVDMEKVRLLASVQCTYAEIAAALGISVDTLDRERKRHPELEEAIENERANGRISLRRMQYRLAEEGNPTMLIWLGKQVLGQKDRTAQEHTGADGGPQEVTVTFREPAK